MSPHNTRDEFRRLLKAENIDTIFRINPVGRIYGVTFIDHNDGIVAAGRYWEKSFRQMFSMNSIRHRKTTSRFQNNTQHRNTKYKTISPILFLALSIRYWT